MNSITPTSINGTIDGPKMAHYQTLFNASIIQLHQTDQLEPFLQILHGDGSNTVVKETSASAIPVISTRR